MRTGDCKLHVSGELYNLREDIGEKTNVAAPHPDVVRRLQQHFTAARADLGDGDAPGRNTRAVGKAKGPLRFWIPRHASSGFPPQAPVKRGSGAPTD
ncbi:MAG: hypothetical protein FJW31_25625 [Acidobacteria bacterium]|nr:hypothetical protein [Acidobacteriota bacterium]